MNLDLNETCPVVSAAGRLALQSCANKKKTSKKKTNVELNWNLKEITAQARLSNLLCLYICLCFTCAFLFWRFPPIWLCTSCPHLSPCLTLSDLSYPVCCRTLCTSVPFLSFMHTQFLNPAAVLDCNRCLSLFGLMFARLLIRFLQSASSQIHQTKMTAGAFFH